MCHITELVSSTIGVCTAIRHHHDWLCLWHHMLQLTCKNLKLLNEWNNARNIWGGHASSFQYSAKLTKFWHGLVKLEENTSCFLLVQSLPCCWALANHTEIKFVICGLAILPFLFYLVPDLSIKQLWVLCNKHIFALQCSINDDGSSANMVGLGWINGQLAWGIGEKVS